LSYKNPLIFATGHAVNLQTTFAVGITRESKGMSLN